jgi:hypothetical protein
MLKKKPAQGVVSLVVHVKAIIEAVDAAPWTPWKKCGYVGHYSVGLANVREGVVSAQTALANAGEGPGKDLIIPNISSMLLIPSPQAG